MIYWPTRETASWLPQAINCRKETSMKVTFLTAAALIAGIGIAVAQDHVPANKTEAATPAPPAQQNAPPDKVAPSPSNSPNDAKPDAKAESSAPALTMETGAHKKTQPVENTTPDRDPIRYP
jgi:hypothetical protein